MQNAAMTRAQIRSKQKKRKAKRKRLFWNIVSAVIIVILAFAISVIFRGSLFGSGKYIFGFQSYITLSDSMSPVIQKGSLLITQRVNPEAIRAGDIITYKEDSEVLTQRVVDIIDNNGAVSFVTMGDANEGVNSRHAPADNVIGRFVYAIGFAGSAMLAMRNPVIMAICVVCACALIIAADSINRRINRRLRRKKRHRRRYPQNDIKTPENNRQSKYGNRNNIEIIMRSV